ncbi:hypothetical protein [Acinetobacter bereziniae]|uniref:hypothetical protein n=1 Tax=Acinetobacter bereziniae TaxID=106648 RepID=UPI001250427A|nr:hypothetical protein [Acinetobacter bereziniae]
MNVLNFLYPTNSLVGTAFKATVDAFNNKKSESIKELEELALKADIEARIFLAQAKVEQELAIANRIASSEEVEIEEFYDTNAKGNLGLSAEEQKLTLGLGAEARKVTKRIIKFNGHSITQIMNDEDK